MVGKFVLQKEDRLLIIIDNNQCLKKELRYFLYKLQGTLRIFVIFMVMCKLYGKRLTAERLINRVLQ